MSNWLVMLYGCKVNMHKYTNIFIVRIFIWIVALIFPTFVVLVCC